MGESIVDCIYIEEIDLNLLCMNIYIIFISYIIQGIRRSKVEEKKDAKKTNISRLADYQQLNIPVA